jgi:hypothetical protein
MPSGQALAATFDRGLGFQYGQVVGAEARAKGFGEWLGPAMDIDRTPLAGRQPEAEGEDPFLAGHTVAAEVLGAKSQHVIATLKHDRRLPAGARRARLLQRGRRPVGGRPGALHGPGRHIVDRAQPRAPPSRSAIPDKAGPVGRPAARVGSCRDTQGHASGSVRVSDLDAVAEAIATQAERGAAGDSIPPTCRRLDASIEKRDQQLDRLDRAAGDRVAVSIRWRGR